MEKCSNLDQLFRSIIWKKAPTLVSSNQCIPCTSAQRIYVNTCARQFGSHHKPAIRWPSFLTSIAEKVMHLKKLDTAQEVQSNSNYYFCNVLFST